MKKSTVRLVFFALYSILGIGGYYYTQNPFLGLFAAAMVARMTYGLGYDMAAGRRSFPEEKLEPGEVVRIIALGGSDFKNSVVVLKLKMPYSKQEPLWLFVGDNEDSKETLRVGWKYIWTGEKTGFKSILDK